MAGYRSGITISTANSYVDEIVRHLQTRLPGRLNVSEIIKAGSLGQGTAVPGKFDLDLVLYSRDISPDDVIRRGVDRELDMLHDVLKSFFRGNFVLTAKTPFALQFTLYGQLEVDLLPSPYWSSSHEFIDKLRYLSPGDQRKFQCSEAKWEKEFFQRQPNEVKEYIKRAKVWRNECWPAGVSGTGRPKSFLLGLLVVEGYRRALRAGHDDPVTIKRKIREMVKNHRYLKVHWIGDGAEYDGSFLRNCQVPCILDPANPFNNVYYSGVHKYRGGCLRQDRYNEGDGDWTNMVKYIDSLDLTQPV